MSTTPPAPATASTYSINNHSSPISSTNNLTPLHLKHLISTTSSYSSTTSSQSPYHPTKSLNNSPVRLIIINKYSVS
jgi:hypothetical protein